MKSIISMFAAASLFVSCQSSESISVKSPDGQVVLHVKTDVNQPIQYAVTFKRDTIIHWSEIQLASNRGLELLPTAFGQSTENEITEKYAIIGKKDSAVHHGYAMEVPFTTSQGAVAQLNLRAYDDGVAYQIVLEDSEPFRLEKEQTQFNFKDGGLITWAGDRGVEKTPYRHSYEMTYPRRAIKDLTDSSLLFTPMAFRTSGGVEGMITEAQVTHYGHLYLAPVADGFAANITPLPGEQSILRPEKQIQTPWRVIMIADQLLDLIDSDLITNLNEPSKIEDTSWIKPGKSAWDWWNDYYVDVPNPGMNQASMKAYLDFASDNGLEYMLVDAFWYGHERDTTEDITTSIAVVDIPELVAYAADRGVGIHLWVNWYNMSKQYEKALPLYAEWGVKGIKMDFMSRNDADMVDFYQTILEETARHKLMLNLHAAYKPTGIRRTYPHLLTREAVLGNEYYKWNDLAGPDHAVTLPFTRGLIGPMDFTPGAFEQVKPEDFEPILERPQALGTRAHQLAMFVVYESPIQMVCDGPPAYQDGEGLSFIQQVPAVWDETVAVSGEIDEYITIARRSESDWYVGGMTNSSARSIDLALDFLDDSKLYNVWIWRDAAQTMDDPKYCERIEIGSVDAASVLKVDMNGGGGFAMRITPLP